MISTQCCIFSSVLSLSSSLSHFARISHFIDFSYQSPSEKNFTVTINNGFILNSQSQSQVMQRTTEGRALYRKNYVPEKLCGRKAAEYGIIMYDVR